MKNQKGFVQIILVLVVLALIGGAYYFGTLKNESINSYYDCQNASGDTIYTNGLYMCILPNGARYIKETTEEDLNRSLSVIDTTKWKVYQNRKYNFSFQYPPQYVVNETDNYPSAGNLLGLVITDSSTKVGHPIIQDKKIDKIIFGITVTQNFNCDSASGDGCSAKKIVKIGNNSFDYYHSILGMSTLFYYDIGDLHMTVEEEGLHNTNTVFAKILSTFKFTK